MSLRVWAALVFSVFLCRAEEGGRVEYVGGTVQSLEEKTGGRVRTTDEQFFVFDAQHNRITIPYDHINLLEYGQKVDRRYVVAAVISPMFLLSKTRQHFLTVGYTDDSGRQQALVFRVQKSDIRMVLVSLEARTGRRVQYQDDEARKAGKG
jgi:hypothetical protein